MAWKRYEIKQPVSSRQPDDNESLLKAVQRELWTFFQQTRKVVNWAARWVGLAQVDADQTPVALGAALIGSSTVVITEVGSTPGKQLQFSASVTGTSPPPATVASTLYPALRPDTKLRVPCTGYSALGAGFGLNFTFWTQIGGVSTWQANSAGFLHRYLSGGNIVPAIGERLFVDCSATGTHEHDGIYEVINPGGLAANAVIRRAADANTPAGLCHDMVVQVLDIGDGTTRWRQLSTADPIVVDTTSLAFSTSTSYASTEAFELLTGPQLTSEGADNVDTLTTSATGAAGTALTQPIPSGFETIVGTPSISSFPAALVAFDVESVTISGLTGTAVLQAGLYVAGGAQIVLASSPPLANGVTTALDFQGLATLTSMSPTDRMTVVYFLLYTSSTDVTVSLVYSSPARGTRITVPFAMPISGASTGRHKDLSGRNDSDQHATSASTPAVATITEISPVGWFSMPTATVDHQLANVDHIRLVLAGTDFYGLDKLWGDSSAVPDFFEVCVYLGTATPSVPLTVHNAASPPGGSSFLPLALPWNEGDDLDLLFSHPTALWFWLDLAGSTWRLKSFVSYS